MARRPYLFAIWVALTAAVAAVVGAIWLDLPLRDPDGVAGPSYIRLPAIVLAPWRRHRAPGLVPHAQDGQLLLHRPLIIRERWTWARVRLVVIGLGCFYLSYVAYRNIKSFLPFVNDNLHDDFLTDLDRWMMFGQRPAAVLHDLLGVGFAAHALSSVYVFYLFFVPISLASRWCGAATSTRASGTSPRCASTGCSVPPATTSCPRSGRRTPTPATSPCCPTPAWPRCRAAC